jgi:hypothetical protein
MKRPFGVTVFALVIVLYGLLVAGISLYGLVLGVQYSRGNVQPELVAMMGRWPVTDLLAITVQLALGVFALVGGISMLRLRPWAWLLGMLLLGCELVIQLGNYVQGHPAYPIMCITALLVFYLNQRPIREAFNLEPASAAVNTDMSAEPASGANAALPPGALEL